MSRRPDAASRKSLYWRIGFGFILFLAITLILQVGAVHLGRRRNRRRHARAHGPRLRRARRVGIRSRAGARSASSICARYAERRVKELHRPAAIIFPDGTAVAPEGTEVPRGMRFPGPFRRRGGGPAAERSGRTGGRRSGRSAMVRPPPIDGLGGPPPDGGGDAAHVRPAAPWSGDGADRTQRHGRRRGVGAAADRTAARSPRRSARRSRSA